MRLDEAGEVHERGLMLRGGGERWQDVRLREREGFVNFARERKPLGMRRKRRRREPFHRVCRQDKDRWRAQRGRLRRRARARQGDGTRELRQPLHRWTGMQQGVHLGAALVQCDEEGRRCGERKGRLAQREREAPRGAAHIVEEHAERFLREQQHLASVERRTERLRVLCSAGDRQYIGHLESGQREARVPASQREPELALAAPRHPADRLRERDLGKRYEACCFRVEELLTRASGHGGRGRLPAVEDELLAASGGEPEAIGVVRVQHRDRRAVDATLEPRERLERGQLVRGDRAVGEEQHEHAARAGRAHLDDRVFGRHPHTPLQRHRGRRWRLACARLRWRRKPQQHSIRRADGDIVAPGGKRSELDGWVLVHRRNKPARSRWGSAVRWHDPAFPSVKARLLMAICVG